MTFESFVGCILCGVRKDISKFKTCRREALRFKIKLVESEYIFKHIWMTVKKPSGWTWGNLNNETKTKKR